MPKLNFDLTVEQAAGTATPFLVGVSEDVEWVDGPDSKRRPGNRIGIRYTVLMLQSECVALVVKTPETTPAISAEDVMATCLSGQFIRVRFENFKVSLYQGKSGMGVSGTADKCVVVTPASGAAATNK